MSKVGTSALGACAALLAAGVIHAGITLDSARVGGEDAVALGKFYELAFGLKEVNRLTFPGGTEIFLNFGASVDAAKANKAAEIVIMQSKPGASADAVAHLIFDVTDVAATAAAVQAAGGKMDGDPKPFGTTGLVIGFAIDPAGNRIELIQRPQR
jgi:predicted enzyme related to lactoylglutathione lyase